MKKHRHHLAILGLFLGGCGVLAPTPPSDSTAGRSFGVSDAALSGECPGLDRREFNLAVAADRASLDRGFDVIDLINLRSSFCEAGSSIPQCFQCLIFVLEVAIEE